MSDRVEGRDFEALEVGAYRTAPTADSPRLNGRTEASS